MRSVPASSAACSVLLLPLSLERPPTTLIHYCCNSDHLWTPTYTTPHHSLQTNLIHLEGSETLRYRLSMLHSSFLLHQHACPIPLLISSCLSDVHPGPHPSQKRGPPWPSLPSCSFSVWSQALLLLPSECLSVHPLFSSPLLCPQLTLGTIAERQFVTPSALPFSDAGKGSFVLCQCDLVPLLLAAKAWTAAVKMKWFGPRKVLRTTERGRRAYWSERQAWRHTARVHIPGCLPDTPVASAKWLICALISSSDMGDETTPPKFAKELNEYM